MIDSLVNAYALVWAMGYLYIHVPVRRWYRRHRRDADYFTHVGWVTGMVLGALMIAWGVTAR